MEVKTIDGHRQVGHLSVSFEVANDGGMDLIIEEPEVQRIVIHLNLTEVVSIRDFINEAFLL